MNAGPAATAASGRALFLSVFRARSWNDSD